MWVTYPVDKCCIINIINYKEKLRNTQRILEKKYPNLRKNVDEYVFKIQKTITKNSYLYKNRLKLYNEIMKRIIDYVYINNIMNQTPVYMMLSYFVYRIKDIYEYEKNTSKYYLDAMIENINKYPYIY